MAISITGLLQHGIGEGIWKVGEKLANGIANTAGDPKVRESVKGGLDEQLKRKKEVREHRHELFAGIHSLPTRPMQLLLQRFAKLDGAQQNRVVEILVHFWMALNGEDDPQEVTTRRETLIYLAYASDDEFWAAIDFLDHDWAVQLIKKYGRLALQSLKAGDRRLALEIYRWHRRNRTGRPRGQASRLVRYLQYLGR